MSSFFHKLVAGTPPALCTKAKGENMRKKGKEIAKNSAFRKAVGSAGAPLLKAGCDFSNFILKHCFICAEVQ